MADENKPPAGQELQFDSTRHRCALFNRSRHRGSQLHRVVRRSRLSTYSVNGHAVCGTCRQTIEAAAETPRGAGPTGPRRRLWPRRGTGWRGDLLRRHRAGRIWRSASSRSLIGYMVGYAVRKGAGDRGGRRFQVLAVVLTYGAVALAYTPVVISAANNRRQEQTQQCGDDRAVAGTGVAAAKR